MTIAYFCENDHRWESEQQQSVNEQTCPECQCPAYRSLNLDNLKPIQEAFKVA